jgi:GntR family transcriptional regulator
VRMADDVPLAIERASLSTAILPDPQAVGASLYAVLAERGLRPVRAVQRISAANLGAADAGLLEVPAGAATLRIERISYLPSGRVVEFTRSLYRGDAYDFAAEMRIPADQEGRM